MNSVIRFVRGEAPGGGGPALGAPGGVLGGGRPSLGLGGGPSPLGDLGLGLPPPAGAGERSAGGPGGGAQAFFRPSDEVAKTADLLAAHVEAQGREDPGSRLLLELLQQQLQWALGHPTFADLAREDKLALREMDEVFGGRAGAGGAGGAATFEGLDILEEWQAGSMFQYEARSLDGV